MYNPLQLENKRILVTGASSGIGRATAIMLSKLGARILLTGRREAELKETESLLSGSGHQIEPFDLLNTAGIADWLSSCAGSGQFHGLVHAAGIVSTKPLRFMEFEEWSQVLHANLDTAFALAKGFRSKSVRAPQATSIVFIASVAAMIGTSGKSAYAASKGGVISLSRTLAAELAREQIRVNCVTPGWVETEMTQNDAQNLTPAQYESLRQRHLLGFGRADDVAASISFLLADTGRWITGSSLVVDGGYSIQ
jgi:NAD(P)-dependent dehydrogenase (short-subunit alcohol dehydrogenase family)